MQPKMKNWLNDFLLAKWIENDGHKRLQLFNKESVCPENMPLEEKLARAMRLSCIDGWCGRHKRTAYVVYGPAKETEKSFYVIYDCCSNKGRKTYYDVE